jgi:hypothetical protein
MLHYDIAGNMAFQGTIRFEVLCIRHIGSNKWKRALAGWKPALRWFGGLATGDCFEDAEDGIAAGEGDEGEEAVGTVFADGFD